MSRVNHCGSLKNKICFKWCLQRVFSALRNKEGEQDVNCLKYKAKVQKMVKEKPMLLDNIIRKDMQT